MRCSLACCLHKSRDEPMALATAPRRAPYIRASRKSPPPARASQLRTAPRKAPLAGRRKTPARRATSPATLAEAQLAPAPGARYGPPHSSPRPLLRCPRRSPSCIGFNTRLTFILHRSGDLEARQRKVLGWLYVRYPCLRSQVASEATAHVVAGKVTETRGRTQRRNRSAANQKVRASGVGT